MPPKKFNHQGLTYGRLYVNAAVESRGTAPYWLCTCVCGNTLEVSSSNLKHGNTKSCGCLHKDTITKHGDYKTRLYNIWKGMVERCRTPGNTYHADKEISVCEEWLTYTTFKEWALCNGYTEDLTIDRVRGDGNYEPSNCRWATYETQARNSVRTAKYKSKSGFTGVYLQQDTGKYSAQINLKGRSTHLGSFETKEDAALARDTFIISNNLKEFKLNFPIK